MKTHYVLDELPSFRRAVITIGSFDGVHLGHQQLLARINRMAQARGGESVVITFDPHPRTVLQPDDNSLRLLTTTAEKERLCSEHGVDHFVVVPFSPAFSQQTATEYIENFLARCFAPDRIVIGYDHRFGRGRDGDVALLRYHAPRLGYEVIEIAPKEVNELTVSSTKIRNALEHGRVMVAAELLGRPYELTGEVVMGKQLGRTIGYPTANLRPTHPLKLIPVDGIYSVSASVGGHLLPGMLYIGNRPALDDGRGKTIELHLFDFSGDLYGQSITVHFDRYLRGDLMLDGMEALAEQLARDESAARAALATGEVAMGETIAHPATAVVILNYNGLPFLERFLPGVIEHLETNCRLIVADNASTDGSLAYVAAHYPAVETIRIAKNQGYAGGYNTALRKIEAEVYVLLNSDVEVTAGWLGRVLPLFRDPTVGAAQPKILAERQRDTFEYAGAAGGYLDFLGYPFCRGRIFGHTERDEGQYDCAAEIFWATGAALFVRASAFHALGGFEAEYFAHAEEIDLCWRMKRAGYRIVAEPSAEVYHVGGGTLAYDTPRKAYLNFRNTLITSFKNEATTRLFWWVPVRLLLDGAAGLLFLSQGKFGHILSILRAHFHFYARLPLWVYRRIRRNGEIERARIGPPRTDAGRLADSVALHYYLLDHQRFSEVMVDQVEVEPAVVAN